MGKYLYNDDPFLRDISDSHGLCDLICGIVNDFNILEIFFCNYVNFPRHRYQLFYFSIGLSEHPCILLCLPSLGLLWWFPIFKLSRCKSFVDFASISGPTRVVAPALATRRHGQIHKVLMNIFKKQNNTTFGTHDTLNQVIDNHSGVYFWVNYPFTLGALVCMSRRDMPVYPGDVIICRRSCAEPGSCLFAVHFLPHDVTFSIHRWCQAPPCGGNWLLCT